jgi:hypothetical protein
VRLIDGWIISCGWLATYRLQLSLPNSDISKPRRALTLCCLFGTWTFQGFRGLPTPVPMRVIGHLSFEGITSDCSLSAMAHVRPSSILSLWNTPGNEKRKKNLSSGLSNGKMKNA